MTTFIHRSMGSKTEFDAVAAELLWRMKATATKEFQAVQGEKSSSSKTCEHTITGVAHPATTTSLPYQTSHPPVLSNVVTMPRSRTISVGSSVDMPLPSNAFSSLVLMEPFLASKGVSPLSPHQGSVMLDHFDWTDRPSSHYHRVSTSSSSSSLISVSEVSSSSTDGAGLLPMKKDRVSSTVTPKVQSFVGQAANANSERGVLRKKFSWRQFPEVRSFRRSYVASLLEHCIFLFSVLMCLDRRLRASRAVRRSARIAKPFFCSHKNRFCVPNLSLSSCMVATMLLMRGILLPMHPF